MRTSVLLRVAAGTILPIACASAAPSSVAGIREINANRDAFVGQTLAVTGRLDVVLNRTAEPCQDGDPRCGWPVSATLHLVVPGETKTPENTIDLFVKAADGTFTPAQCRIVSATAVDCAPRMRDAIETVRGTFVKDRQPSVYFLVIDR